MRFIAIAISCILFLMCACILKAQNRTANPNVPRPAQPAQPAPAERLPLGEPNFTGTMSLEQTIAGQARATAFQTLALEAFQLRQLAWAGQRAITLAGTSLPPQNSVSMGLYFCLWGGVYRYNPAANALDGLSSADVRNMLAVAAQNQTALQQAPCTIVIAGSGNPSAAITREQARSMMMLNAGRIAQNIELEAQSLGLATLGVGSFDIVRVKRIARLSPQQEPVYLIAAGYPVATPQPTAKTEQKNVLIIVPGNTRPNELYNSIDMLNAAGIKTTVAQSGPTMVTNERPLEPDLAMQNVVVGNYDGVIVVGGSGNSTFMADPVLLNIIRTAVRAGIIVGAAGQTTAVFANAGVLNGVRVTGDPQQLFNSGGIYTNSLLESDRGIVTALNSQQSNLVVKAFIDSFKGETRESQPAQPYLQQPPPPQPQPMQRVY
jgi:SagB-type dehydrogenase family enzyme